MNQNDDDNRCLICTDALPAAGADGHALIFTFSCCGNRICGPCSFNEVGRQMYTACKTAVEHRYEPLAEHGLCQTALRPAEPNDSDVGLLLKCPWDRRDTLDVATVAERYRASPNIARAAVLLENLDGSSDDDRRALRNHFFVYMYQTFADQNGFSLAERLRHNRGVFGHVTGDMLRTDRDFLAPGLGLEYPDRDHRVMARLERLVRVALDLTCDDLSPDSEEGDAMPMFDERAWVAWCRQMAIRRIGAYFVGQVGRSCNSTHGERAVVAMTRARDNPDQIVPSACIQTHLQAIEEWGDRTSIFGTSRNDMERWFGGPHVTITRFTLDPQLRSGPNGQEYNTFAGLPHVRRAEAILAASGERRGTWTDAQLRALIDDNEARVGAASVQELRAFDARGILLHALHACWCRSDAATTVSTLKLLSCWVQRPGVRQGVFLLLQGRTGGQGKGLILVELLMHRIFGAEPAAHMLQGASELARDFHMHAASLFQYFDDMPRLAPADWDKLKTLVTAPEVNEHHKYAAEVAVPNRCNWAACTNHTQPPAVAGDRRVHLLECTDVLVPRDNSATITRSDADEARRGAVEARLIDVCTLAEWIPAATALFLLADIRGYSPRDHRPDTRARREAQLLRDAAGIEAARAHAAEVAAARQLVDRHNAGDDEEYDPCLLVLLYQLGDDGSLTDGLKYSATDVLGLLDELLEVHPSIPLSYEVSTAVHVGRGMSRLLGSLWCSSSGSSRGVRWVPARIKAALRRNGHGVDRDWGAVFRRYSGADDEEEEEGEDDEEEEDANPRPLSRQRVG